MPVEVSYERNGRLVVLTGSGVVTGSELRRVNEAMYREPDLMRQRAQIVDLTAVDSLDVSTNDVRILAVQDAAAARANPELKIVVAGSKDIVYGMARMWKAVLAEVAIPTHVVRTVADARAWVDDVLSASEPGGSAA